MSGVAMGVASVIVAQELNKHHASQIPGQQISNF